MVKYFLRFNMVKPVYIYVKFTEKENKMAASQRVEACEILFKKLFENIKAF